MRQTKSRKYNSIRNIIFGLGSQVVYLLLVFLCRTVLIKKLGAEILGINGLYSNILTILSFAELGIGNTLLFSLYKPLADGDKEKISSLLKFYSKLYNIIAIVVFCVGLSIMPFLKFIISADIAISSSDLIIFYLIFVLNSALSYPLCYKQNLINADQKNYIIKISNLIYYIVTNTLQVIFLFILPDYKIYLIITCVCTVIQNVVLSIIVDKIYPFIKQKPIKPLDLESKKLIGKNIASTFLYKIGTVIQTSTDNILISTIVSTLVVGYYSNYNMIITAVTAFINIIIYALWGGLGNLGTEKDSQKSYDVFNCLLFFFQYIAIFCTICFVTVFNDFITIWLGSEYLFNTSVVIVISLTFYFSIAVSPIWMYRETFGLFGEVKYLMIIAAMINIGLSILLGIYLGIFGILISTIISKMLTTYIFEPFILFKKVFNKKPTIYFMKQIIALCVGSLITATLYFVYQYLPSDIIGIFTKILINFVIVTGLYACLFGKSKEFTYMKDAIKSYLSKK